MTDDEITSQPLFTSVNAPDPNWRYNAQLNMEWSTYAEGYKALADMGVDHALEEYPVDILVYPIIFCYRQYLELRLKELIQTAGSLLDQRLALPTNHDLHVLWAAVRPLLEKIWPSDAAQRGNDRIDAVVAEFAKADPRSMAFRYPVDTKGNRSLPGMKVINLKSVKDIINEIAPTLDGASIGIEEYLDTRRDMLAEYHQEARYYADPPQW